MALHSALDTVLNTAYSKFAHWNTEAPEGTPAYYSKQYYKHGTRCWNGPERSVVVCQNLPFLETLANDFALASSRVWFGECHP